MAARVPVEMSAAAGNFLAALDDGQRALAARDFGDDAARHWLEYRPRARPGACLADFDRRARKAAMRLLATGLSPHAYAQAVMIIGLEEVLDRYEGWGRGRHSNDYWVTVFGDPARDDAWSWRFEGHHLSVSMTIVDGRVSPAPVFFGANPHRVTYNGRAVLQPLDAEEELGRELLAAMSPEARAAAIVADQAPIDIRSATNPSASSAFEPYGVSSARLGQSARDLLDHLVRVYVGRLPPEIALAAPDELHFAWEGPTTPGGRHYYRIQGDDLLIEYDNTASDGNHAHTVLRRPRSDFGHDILAQHRRTITHR